MRKIYSCLCALCVGLLVAACTTDEILDVANSNTKSELKLVKVPVDIEAPFTSEAETRGMTHDSEGYALYDFDSMVVSGKAYDVFICLKDTTNDSLVYTTGLTSKLTKTSSGAYTISIPNAEVNIVDGTDISRYKVCALLNTGITSDYFKAAFIDSAKVDLDSLPYTDGTHSISGMCVPMYSSYKNSTLTGNNEHANITLNFYMIGSVVTAKVNGNPLAVPVNISKFSLNACNVKTGVATYKFGEEDYKGDPAFKFTSSSDTCIFEWAKTATRYLPSVLSDTKSDTTVTGDFWCFPISNHSFSQQYGLDYELVQNNSVYAADSINYVKSKVVALDTGFVSGNCYQVSLSLPESELMITEYEHLEPGDNNYSMIEIYNPTNVKKDLRNYGLIRQTALKHTSSGSPEYKTVGSISYGTTDDITEARIQDLYIDSVDNGAENEKYVNGKTVSGLSYSYTNSYTLYEEYKDANNNGAYSNTVTYKGFTLAPYELAPGQTIVLFAGGTKNLLDNNNTTSNYLPDGSLYFNSQYLTKAIDAGDCKYAIAVDNGAVKNVGSGDSRYRAGVFQVAQSNNIILMKKITENSDTSSYKILDAVFSLDPNDYDRSYWVWNYPETSSGDGTSTADDHRIVSRRKSVMYPYTLRPDDNDQYFNVTLHTLVKSPLNGHIWDGFDWQYIFSDNGYFDVNAEINGDLVSPGTRNVVESYKTTN